MSTDESMECESDLIMLDENLKKCDTGDFRVGKNYHRVTVNEPIFTMARP
jgi:hypothetical protein